MRSSKVWWCLSLGLAGTACTIPQGGLQLGIPYYQQELNYYCTPACVQMWRGYDGLLPFYSQRSLFEAMGGTIGCGTQADQVERAVQLFTSARDAYLDSAPGSQPNAVEGYFARQITSIDSRTPVLVLANSHAVILNGGGWHRDSMTGLNVWDFVYVHDPALGANRYTTANRWTIESCEFFGCRQIVSQAAVRGWDTYLANWGEDLGISGRPRGGVPVAPTETGQ
jgi:hypothetical protein